MHALDLLLQIRAPLDFAQLDERDCVRRVYAAVIEQVSSSPSLITCTLYADERVRLYRYMTRIDQCPRTTSLGSVVMLVLCAKSPSTMVSIVAKIGPLRILRFV